MLTLAQRNLVAGVAVVCACLMAALVAAGLRPLPQPALSPEQLRFDALSAMGYTKALSEQYPNRVSGSLSSRRAAAFIKRRFEALGYRVTIQRFLFWAYGSPLEGENVIATTASQAKPYVAVLAHYDSPRTTYQAAEDDASGVGTMLELARTLRTRRVHAIFIATDGEELGMIGARHIAQWLRTQGTGDAISIDYINAGASSGVQVTAAGQFGGYAPVALRQLARAAAEQQSATVLVPYGIGEWIDRAVERSFQDQGPLLEAGIPAVDLLSIPADLAAARDRYHTPRDAYAGFRPAVFATIGRTVERTVLTLAHEPPMPAGDGFTISTARYLSYDVLWIVLFLPLVPLMIAVMCVGTNIGVKPVLARTNAAMDGILTLLGPVAIVIVFLLTTIAAVAVVLTPLILFLIVPLITAAVLTRYKARLLALTAPAFAAYILVREFALHNVIPRFELYPPPPKDPLLYHPPALAIAAIAAVLIAGYALASARPMPLLDKGTLLSWTTAVALAAFAIDPFALWLYLGLFILAALLFIEHNDARAVIINGALLAVSVAPFLAVVWYFAREIFVGGYVWWYLVLQCAYGTWSFWIAGSAIFAAVLWVQYARLAILPYMRVRVAARHRVNLSLRPQ